MKGQLFVTGTGTDVGKTFVSALIVKKMHNLGENVGYYKAAVSGNERDENGQLIPGDALYVREKSGISQSLDSMCPFIYEQAFSPHLAGKLEGQSPDVETIFSGLDAVKEKHDYVLMEGSGGILCPIVYDKEKLLLWELISKMQMPCVIVADAGLGTINDVGLTVFFMKEKKIPIKGIIFNHFHPGDIMEEDNLKMCEELFGVPVVACVKDGDTTLEMEDHAFRELFND